MIKESVLEDGTKRTEHIDAESGNTKLLILESTKGDKVFFSYSKKGMLTKEVEHRANGTKVSQYYEANGDLRKKVVERDGLVSLLEEKKNGVWHKTKGPLNPRIEKKLKQQQATGEIGCNVRTNPIPGRSARVKYDELTGRSYETRGQYERHMIEAGIAEVHSKYDHAEPPSEATYPKRPDGCKVGDHGVVISGFGVDQNPEAVSQQLYKDMKAGKLGEYHKTPEAAKRRDFKARKRENIKRGTGYS